MDVGLFTVTPPDENGFCSLGLTVNCGYDALRVAKKAIGMEFEFSGCNALFPVLFATVDYWYKFEIIIFLFIEMVIYYFLNFN